MRASSTHGWRLGAAIGVLLLGVVLYLGISYVSVYQLTKPRKLDFPPIPPSYAEVSFPAYGTAALQVAGWFLSNPARKKAVILVHGKDMSKGTEFQCKFAELGNALHSKGFGVLLIDLRGHGDSDESLVSFGLDERYDIIGAVEWLEGRGYEPGKIGVLGVSMGAASAIGAAAENSAIGAVVSDCSYAEVLPIIGAKWSTSSGLPNFLLPSTVLMGRLLLGHNLEEAKPVEDIRHISPRPVLLIHSQGDTWVPIQHARALKAAYPSASLWETGEVDHCLSFWSAPEEYTQRVAEFFQNNLQ